MLSYDQYILRFIISRPLRLNWYRSVNKHYFDVKFQLFVALIKMHTVCSQMALIVQPLPFNYLQCLLWFLQKKIKLQ